MRGVMILDRILDLLAALALVALLLAPGMLVGFFLPDSFGHDSEDYRDGGRVEGITQAPAACA